MGGRDKALSSGRAAGAIPGTSHDEPGGAELFVLFRKNRAPPPAWLLLRVRGRGTPPAIGRIRAPKSGQRPIAGEGGGGAVVSVPSRPSPGQAGGAVLPRCAGGESPVPGEGVGESRESNCQD